MRYLKPHFYDQFVCTAGDCPDTCCAGWQIVIDEDSLERYGNEKSEFGKRLRNSIDWEEECFYQNNRRCAFLNDENLCDLYKALGPDSLCDTCRLYPRHTEEYEGLRELSLSLSCPEAARIILSCKEPVRFLEEETDEEDDFEEFDFMMLAALVACHKQHYRYECKSPNTFSHILIFGLINSAYDRLPMQLFPCEDGTFPN